MNRDFFVNKVLSGGEVTLADVVKSNAELELDAINREVAAKRAAETARIDAETHRQEVLTELLTLTRELEAKNAGFRALRDERDAMNRALDEKESALSAETRQTRLKLDFAFRFFNNNEPLDPRSPQTAKTLDWLRSQGVEINANW
jgi:septal ring factor EnvC (AmiA/AmiB activator)